MHSQALAARGHASPCMCGLALLPTRFFITSDSNKLTDVLKSAGALEVH